MTPQSYSYPTVGSDNLIYVPPYGLNSELDKLLIINPITYEMSTVQLECNGTLEKYTHGIPIKDKIYWIPYGESRVLVYDTISMLASYIDIAWPIATDKIRGKFVMGHVFNDRIYALPYGETEILDYVLCVDLTNDTASLIELNVPNSDRKKWHQSVLHNGKLIAVPRGTIAPVPFNLSIEFDCNTHNYVLTDMSNYYEGYAHTNMKYTTISILDDVIYAPPYGYVDDFDHMLINENGTWRSERTGITQTTRKYFTSILTKNNKLYFPPAGHHHDWNKFLVINSDGTYNTFDTDMGNESKKYFAGVENSKGKVYYIPRGGCVCDPVTDWKMHGDLAKVLVVDTKDDSHYTIDISSSFTDSTTIEKYNSCCMVNDVIYAFPYGESDSFQTVLVFDTITETIIKTIDLNDLQIL